jgi:hypothetical protein
VVVAEALNERELSRYVSRVSDRWPLERALLDEVTFDEVVEAARSVDPDELAVACVGPHSVDDF